MPIYEYDCPGCGESFEKRVSMSEADSTPCPHCGSEHPRRRISQINVKVAARSGGSTISLPMTGST